MLDAPHHSGATAAPHIVLVEPDPSYRALLRSHLEHAGFTVSARSVAQVLGLGDDDADLVLLNAVLPGVHGIEVCALLREDGYSGGLLMHQEGATELDRVAGLDAGADDYLTRPAPLAELAARIHAVLARVRRQPPSDRDARPVSGRRAPGPRDRGCR